VWAVEGDLDVDTIVSNEFELEWPPRSGEMRRFPEVDRAAWMSVATARIKLLKGQVGFVDRLMARLEEQSGYL
jgi:predicted NUDIX family NTP pyrophosphohydrolase